MKKLRVLSYNIHKGFTSGNRTFVLERIREAIRSVHADLVFLQEVLGRHDVHGRSIESWPSQSQFEYLADTIWPHFAYGKNAVYSAGHHGNAILSKYPFTLWDNIDVSTSRLERRGLLHGVIEIPHQRDPVHLICVHLGLREVDRKNQVERLCQRIAAAVPHHQPLLIAGDFNDWRGRLSPSLAAEVECREVFENLYGKSARTFPAWFPSLRLDRIYYRNLEANTALSLSGYPWKELSDHVALYGEFTTR